MITIYLKFFFSDRTTTRLFVAQFRNAADAERFLFRQAGHELSAAAGKLTNNGACVTAAVVEFTSVKVGRKAA